MSISADFPLTGVAYVSQIENEHMGAEGAAICNNCYKSGTEHEKLRRCTGCKLTNYCSRECQKKQWPRHKYLCALVQGKGAKNDYLSSMASQEQVYQKLIDSYRLRVENDHRYRGEHHGIYHAEEEQQADPTGNALSSPSIWAKGDAASDFQAYLDHAEDSHILPAWWSFDERMECLLQAMDKSKRGNVFEPVIHQELLATYKGDLTSQFALRILAELCVGYDGQGPPVDDHPFYQLQGSSELDNGNGREPSTDENAHLRPRGVDDDELVEEDENDIPLDTARDQV